MKLAGLFLFAIAMLILGTICVWAPEKVQILALRWVGRGVTANWRLLNSFVGSKQYLLNLRAVGVGALLGSAFLLWMLTRNL